MLKVIISVVLIFWIGRALYRAYLTMTGGNRSRPAASGAKAVLRKRNPVKQIQHDGPPSRDDTANIVTDRPSPTQYHTDSSVEALQIARDHLQRSGWSIPDALAHGKGARQNAVPEKEILAGLQADVPENAIISSRYAPMTVQLENALVQCAGGTSAGNGMAIYSLLLNHTGKREYGLAFLKLYSADCEPFPNTADTVAQALNSLGHDESTHQAERIMTWLDPDEDADHERVLQTIAPWLSARHHDFFSSRCDSATAECPDFAALAYFSRHHPARAVDMFAAAYQERNVPPEAKWLIVNNFHHSHDERLSQALQRAIERCAGDERQGLIDVLLAVNDCKPIRSWLLERRRENRRLAPLSLDARWQLAGIAPDKVVDELVVSGLLDTPTEAQLQNARQSCEPSFLRPLHAQRELSGAMLWQLLRDSDRVLHLEGASPETTYEQFLAFALAHGAAEFDFEGAWRDVEDSSELIKVSWVIEQQVHCATFHDYVYRVDLDRAINIANAALSQVSATNRCIVLQYDDAVDVAIGNPQRLWPVLARNHIVYDDALSRITATIAKKKQPDDPVLTLLENC